jgi:hypothetical protein
MHFLRATVSIFLILGVGFLTGCGPNKEQILQFAAGLDRIKTVADDYNATINGIPTAAEAGDVPLLYLSYIGALEKLSTLNEIAKTAKAEGMPEKVLAALRNLQETGEQIGQVLKGYEWSEAEESLQKISLLWAANRELGITLVTIVGSQIEGNLQTSITDLANPIRDVNDHLQILLKESKKYHAIEKIEFDDLGKFLE